MGDCPKHAFEEVHPQDDDDYRKWDLFRDDQIPSSASASGEYVDVDIDQVDISSQAGDGATNSQDGSELAGSYHSIADLDETLKQLEAEDAKNNIPEIRVETPSEREQKEMEEALKKSMEDTAKTTELTLPDNFVTRYLKEKHPQYYKALLDGKENYEPINLPATSTAVTVSDPKKDDKKDELDAKSKNELEIERLAKLTVDHPEFEEKIKKPIDEKLAKELAEKLKKTEREKNLVRVDGPKEITARIDDKTTMIITKLGDAEIITENAAGNITTRKIVISSTPFKDGHRHVCMDDIYEKLNIGERLSLALSRFIINCRRDSREKIQSFAWKSYSDPKVTMAEVLIKTYGGRTLPKEAKLAALIGTDTHTASDLRQFWNDSCKMYCVKQ